MNRIIGIILAVVLAAGCQEEQRPVETKKLFLPRDSEKTAADSIEYTDNVLTLILAPNNSILYYAGKFKDQSLVNTVDYKGVRDVLLDFKKKAGDSMYVMIKPHTSATYKNTVDILDEMTVNEIKKYALVDLTTEEKRTILNETSSNDGWEDDDVLTVTVPKSVTTSTSRIRRKGIIITVHSNNTLSWQTDDLVAVTTPKEISPVTKDNIKKVISDYRKSIGTDSLKTDFIVRGPKDAGYTNFKILIEAMKELELYKFSFEDVPD